MITNQLIIAGIIAFISSCIGMIVGQFVDREKLCSVKEMLARHDILFSKIVFKDVCNKCIIANDNRHQDLLDRLTIIYDLIKTLHGVK